MSTTHGSPGTAITVGVKSLAQKLMRQAKIQGLSIGVVHPDGSVESASLGSRSEEGDSMTTDTLFAIASCSKAFLAASLGILMEDFAKGHNQTALPSEVHKLDWHTRVTELLPDDWVLMDGWATEKATLSDILSHQSGLPRHDFSYKPTDKPLDVLRRMQHLRPAFELRQRWHYNNQMYVTGAHLISTYSGMPYIDYVQERILGPLNMTSTTFSPSEALASGKRTEAWTNAGRRIPFWMTDDISELTAGLGGIVSNVEDLTKWIRLLLNAGVDPVTNRTIIPSSTYQEVTSSHSIVTRRSTQPYLSPVTYGLGWMPQYYQGHEILEHSGAVPGFSAEVVFLPFDKLGVVVLANSDEKHQQELAVIYRIIEDYLKLPRKESDRLAAITEGKYTEQVISPVSTVIDTIPMALPLFDYAGHYYDPGYGTLTLCAPSSTPPPECTSVLHEFSPFYDTSNSSIPELYSAISSIWVSHLQFVHKSANAFTLRSMFLFPNGYGKDRTPFKTDGLGELEITAEFLVEGGKVKGLALNGFVGEMTERQRAGGSLEDAAEVWFRRM